MKNTKRKYEFKLFRWRVVISISTFPHGYKRKPKLYKFDPDWMKLPSNADEIMKMPDDPEERKTREDMGDMLLKAHEELKKCQQ